MWPVSVGSIALLSCAAMVVRFDEQLTKPLIMSATTLLFCAVLTFKRRAVLVARAPLPLARVRLVWASALAVSLVAAALFFFSLYPNDPDTPVTLGAECLLILAILVWTGALGYADWFERSRIQE